MNPNKSIQAQSQSIRQLIEAWLSARQELLIHFNHLCSLRPFDQPNLTKKDLLQSVTNFCNYLVDYISLGQFEMFEPVFQIIENSKVSDPLTNKRILALLIKTTMSALDFNDNVSQTINDLKTFDTELAFVGERLAHRLELEDKLIEQVFYALD